MINYTYIFRFLIGLAITLSYLYAAFEYKTEIIDDSYWEEPYGISIAIEIPPNICLPPPPFPYDEENIPITYQERQAPLHQEFSHAELTAALQHIVTDDLSENVDSPFFVTEEEEDIEICEAEEQVEEEETEDEFMCIYIVEKNAIPVGGMKAFYQYLKKELKYPKEAKKRCIEGKVFLSFIVNADSTISDVKIIRGIHPLLDEEAVRVMKKSPKWVPGEQCGKPVNQKMTFPIRFVRTKGCPNAN